MSNHQFKYVTELSRQWQYIIPSDSDFWDVENHNAEVFIPGEHSSLKENAMGSGEEFDYERFFTEFKNKMTDHIENDTLPDYTDRDAAVFIYTYLQDNGMTPRIAANKEIWLYMCLVHFKEYVWLRWRKSTKYMARMTVSEPRRNALARLWRFAYLTHDAEASDPYHLTVFPFRQELWNFTTDTILSGNRHIWMEAVKYIKNNAETANNNKFIRKFLRLVRVKNAVVKLNTLEEDELKDRIVSIAAEV